MLAVLLTDADVDAYCLEYFPKTKRRYVGGMDRDSKVTLLLELEPYETILQNLRDAYRTAVERHLPGLLTEEAASPAAAVSSPPATASSTRLDGGSAAKVQKWDFFIAHAGPDTEPAVSLYDLLRQSGYRPYVDKKCLLPGDDWSVELPRAQSQARMTIVLVSSRCERAYYQREEIAAAIALARDEKYSHRVVPVYLTGWPNDAAAVPYGLRSKHGLNAAELGGMPGVANAMDELMKRLQATEAENSSQS